MAIKEYKPTSPGRRGMSVVDQIDGLTKKASGKGSLTEKFVSVLAGEITVEGLRSRFRGGGHKRLYR